MTAQEYEEDVVTAVYGDDSVVVTRPQYSDWRVHLLNGVVFTPKKNCEPNRFHRWMQALAFGVKWERVP